MEILGRSGYCETVERIGIWAVADGSEVVLRENLTPEHTQGGTYDLMEQAIAFMRAQQHQQPDLATIAAHVNLSEYHFQKIFTRWVGISPKRFLQTLTVADAKSRIASSETVLAWSDAVGVSSPGRLHDLFVTLEAMSPGEARRQGDGLTIQYGLHDTPLGWCAIAKTPRGICRLEFLPDSALTGFITALRQDWPRAELSRVEDVTLEIAQLICGESTEASPALQVYVKGTNFQVQVWRALLNIPPGQLVTYGGLAKVLGRPQAARAIGTAVGRNPVGYFIPCHRVIRESGALGGYRWGLDRKALLLAKEAGR